MNQHSKHLLVISAVVVADVAVVVFINVEVMRVDSRNNNKKFKKYLKVFKSIKYVFYAKCEDQLTGRLWGNVIKVNAILSLT